MRPRWKRGSSWVDQNPPARVYRRRGAPPPDAAAAGAGTTSTNTGPGHSVAPAHVDPPPPSNRTGPAHRDAPAPRVDPPLPPTHVASPAPLDSPPSTDELSRSAPASSSTPLRGAAGPSVGQLPPSPDKGSPPSDPSLHGRTQQRCSADAATTPRRRETWRPKEKAPPSPVRTPGDVAPPRQSQSRPDVAAATATPQAHAAFPTASPDPSPPPSAPAGRGRGRVTPPLPSSAPYCRGTTPSSGAGSGSRSEHSTSSSSSGAARSGNRSTASSSSSTNKSSYAALFQGARRKKADTNLRNNFFDFLNKFTMESAEAPYYTAQVAALRVQHTFKLEIQFEHMLEHSLEMAIDICNKKERASEFVRPVVQKFLFEKKLSENLNEIREKAEASFISMPSSIEYISEFVAENAGKLVTTEILAGNMRECIATDTGMMLVQRSAAEVFRGHSLGLTWEGGFELKDMVLLNKEEVRIAKRPVPGGSSGKQKDVRQLAALFMPSFWKDGKLPLYFRVLNDDLEKVTEADVTEDWYMEYILGHPGLRPSMIRYNLVDGVHQSCKKFNISGSAIKRFLDQKPSWNTDWRALVPTHTADAFYKVFWYRSQPGDGTCQPFEPTNGGILAYKRNFTRHGDLYLNVQDLSEVEKIGARNFEDALPDILKQLLKDCQMHKRQPLLVHWKPYRDARLGRDGHYHRDGVVGVYPTFW